MLEKKVEAALVAGVEARGGLAIKLNPAGFKGIPDRLVLLPLARVAFVELKRPKGGKWSSAQRVWHSRLTALGFECAVLSSVDEVHKWLDSA